METGKEETILIQGSLRPSLFGSWEYVFPEECLGEVIAVMGIGKVNIKKAGIGILRNMLSCKKIPEEVFEAAKKIPTSLTLSNSWRGLSTTWTAGVSVYPIGIKKDERKEITGLQVDNKTGTYLQEAL